MYMNKDISTLASFATLKVLSDMKKYNNPYQILSEFIKYIIKTKKLYTFSSVEMKNQLQLVFGFDIPEAVVTTVSKKLDFISRERGDFLVDMKNFACDDLVEKTKENVETVNNNIMNLLIDFIKEKKPDAEIYEDILIHDFFAFLVGSDVSTSGKYMELIGQFVFINEKNILLQETLRSIREGSILYIGLNHNINETGSLKKCVTLFLGTEILFSLVGYNGEIYKQLAHEFYDLIKHANRKEKKITLCFFPETQKEIDEFFGMAESIVAGQVLVDDKPAMKAIINNCVTTNDVAIKKADFYHDLKTQYKITLYDKVDFYAEKYDQFNLESMTGAIFNELDPWKFVSHVNKLRNGEIYDNNFDAEYLFVTNTKSIIKASNEQTENMKQEHNKEIVNDYAVSLSKITNYLWYKLGKGFSQNSYPNNVDVVLKARTVLAASITRSISEVYTEIEEQYKKGIITADKVAARILTLRDKPTLPEELESDSIEDSMDFSTEYLSRYEEEVNKNKATIKEKDIKIQQLEEERRQQLTEKDATIAQKEELIESKNKENAILKLQLEKYHEEERIKKEKIDRRKKRTRFAIGLTVRLIILVVLIGLIYIINVKVGDTFFKIACWFFDAAGILIVVIPLLKDFYARCFGKKQ